MQDLKHISKKKRLLRINVLKSREDASTHSRKMLVESRPDRKRLRLLLPLLALILAAYPILNLLVSTRNAISSVGKSPKAIENYKELDTWRSLQLAAELLPTSHFEAERLLAPLPDGGTIVYAINEELQQQRHLPLAGCPAEVLLREPSRLAPSCRRNLSGRAVPH